MTIIKEMIIISINKTARLFEVNTIDVVTAKLLFSSLTLENDIVEFFRITTGGSTSNYKVVMNNSVSYLLRVYPNDNDHSDIEMAAYSYARRLINVPEIYFVDNSKKIISNTYVIMKFIDGITLQEYMIKNTNINQEILISIGKSLALLHNRNYGAMAILNSDLSSVLSPLGSTYQLFEYYLVNLAGRTLSAEVKIKLGSIMNAKKELFTQIDDEYVLTHGDFNFSNIIIDKSETAWFIDFEYCFSAPRYYDIGKFFRTSNQFDKLLLRDCFIKGYQSVYGRQLPDNWWCLSKLIDIQTMLALMNREKLPEGWANEIEKEIRRNIRIIDI